MGNCNWCHTFYCTLSFHACELLVASVFNISTWGRAEALLMRITQTVFRTKMSSLKIDLCSPT